MAHWLGTSIGTAIILPLYFLATHEDTSVKVVDTDEATLTREKQYELQAVTWNEAHFVKKLTSGTFTLCSETG